MKKRFVFLAAALAAMLLTGCALRTVEEMYALLSTGTAEHASDVFQPKNILTYAKTLSGDADMRHLLSEEFQGLITAARKAYTTMSSKSLPAGKEK